MPLVDTSVLLDLFTNDPIWADWSARQLRILSAQEALIVNPVVYAELSVGYDRVEHLDAALATAGVELVEIPRAALFLAGRAFETYRAQRGTRTGVLPDFFIGAHAVVEGISVLTRDARRYRSYFPTVELITPGDA
ncbi:MAG TPA: PIN domain-containing protein [Geminicoccaceae bacterium]|nr:PIN domain-containing protein [Geminicoccaceae bacterium]